MGRWLKFAILSVALLGTACDSSPPEPSAADVAGEIAGPDRDEALAKQDAADAQARTDALEALIHLLGNESADARSLAAEALMQKGEQARPQLASAVTQGDRFDADARLGAALVLWRMDSDSTAEQRLGPLLGTGLHALRDPAPLAVHHEALDYLREQSRDADKHIRGNAYILLSAWGVAALDWLLPVLDEEDDIGLRTAVAVALSHVQDPRTISPLLAQLEWVADQEWGLIEGPETDEELEFTGDESEEAEDGPPSYDWSRQEALAEAAQRALRAQGAAAVRPVLEADGNGSIQPQHTLGVLQDMDRDELVPALTALLADPGPANLATVSGLLADTGDPRAAVPLLEALPDMDSDTAGSGRRAVLQLGLAALEPCLARLGDKTPAIRAVCISVLAAADATAHAEALRAALGDPDPEVVAAAAEGVGLGRDRAARDQLLELLRDEADLVRVSAADALGRLADPTTVGQLVAAIERLDRTPDTYLDEGDMLEWYEHEIDQDERLTASVMNAGVDALVAIGAPAVPPVLDALEQGAKAPAAARLIDTLARIEGAGDDPRTGPLLIAALKGADRDRQAAAVRALAALHPPDWLDTLIEGFAREADKEYGLLPDYAMALGESRSPAAAQALVDALPDIKNESQQEMVMTAIGRNGSEPARTWLESAMAAGKLQAIAMAHEYFIRAGIPGSEQKMVDALNEWGTAVMAVDMLNSGNETLSAAARRWAEEGGYQIIYLPDTGGAPRWGSRR
jgi:HEAT repeat protein